MKLRYGLSHSGEKWHIIARETTAENEKNELHGLNRRLCLRNRGQA